MHENLYYILNDNDQMTNDRCHLS